MNIRPFVAFGHNKLCPYKKRFTSKLQTTEIPLSARISSLVN